VADTAEPGDFVRITFQPQQAQHLGIAVLIDDVHALVPVNKIMNLTGEGESPQAAIAGVDIVLAS
jgi:hypothetical protein